MVLTCSVTLSNSFFQTPFVRHYVEAAHDYVVSGADFLNYYF